MNIYLEIFGYIGTALVLTSMLMTSVVKLRAFNAVGSLISMIYAYLSGTLPVAILNLVLLVINTVQLIRLSRAKVSFDFMQVPPEDRSLLYFLEYYREDICRFFPQFAGRGKEGSQVYMVCRETEPAGVLIGRLESGRLRVELDYTTPKYRDCSVAGFLFSKLKDVGITSVETQSDNKAHLQYLRKMGFREQGGRLVKDL